ncbi:RICIN domain-containing protein [Longispora albida]|uniref:RICIN domain-containing protein n=1 Tax=Longispora albida TaxID=203523 RepID=UPI00037CA908|nr:ricin-type beta-trefoil lectin domain protein [Longispora albida]
MKVRWKVAAAAAAMISPLAAATPAQAGSGFWYQSVPSGLCLTAQEWNMGQVSIQGCDDRPGQNWAHERVYTSSGVEYVRFRSQNGYCITEDVTDGASVYMIDCNATHNTSARWWRVVENGGRYSFIGLNSGNRCLNANGESWGAPVVAAAPCAPGDGSISPWDTWY